jgi:hypothetical protein
MPVSPAGLRLLSANDVIDQLRALRAKQPVKFTAFYSSQLGGVVTDPALMVIPFDDHMVHRGHGIFTAFLTRPASSTAGFTTSRRTSIVFSNPQNVRN